jgi:hypothetical protein
MKEWDVMQHEAENSEKRRSQLLLSNKPLKSSTSIQNISKTPKPVLQTNHKKHQRET